MKLYLFDTINRYKRYSETLDVKTKICNRPWIVFNDGGEKEVYKFKEDGTINIVLSGRVTKGTWEYDPTDKTIIISASDQSYMVHPGMYDDMLLALQVDGTDQCSFLIEENNSKNFAPQTYSELMLYFEEMERRRIEEMEMRRIEERARRTRERRNEEEARRRRNEEEARRRSEEEARKEKEKQDKMIVEEFKAFLAKNNYKSRNSCFYKILAILGCFGLFVLLANFAVYLGRMMGYLGVVVYLVLLFGGIIGYWYLGALLSNVYKFNRLLKEFVNLPEYKDKIDYNLESVLNSCW